LPDQLSFKSGLCNQKAKEGAAWDARGYITLDWVFSSPDFVVVHLMMFSTDEYLFAVLFLSPSATNYLNLKKFLQFISCETLNSEFEFILFAQPNPFSVFADVIKHLSDLPGANFHSQSHCVTPV
jgi:hypothetical protein